MPLPGSRSASSYDRAVPGRIADTWWFGNRARTTTGSFSLGWGAGCIRSTAIHPALQFPFDRGW